MRFSRTARRRGSEVPARPATTTSVRLDSFRLRMRRLLRRWHRAVFGHTGRQEQATPDRKEMKIVFLGQESPEAAWKLDGRRDGQAAECDQVPSAIVGKQSIENIEDEHAHYGTFDGSDAADHDDEDGESGPVDGEGGVGRDS